MKFFTPQLYVQFNSRDFETASRADDKWDRAQAEYELRLNSLRAEMPESVRFIAHQFCLHDAEFLGLTESPESIQVRVRKHDTVYVLDYHPTAAAEVSTPSPSDVFSQYSPRWLYDEIDLLWPGTYSHEILLSDGRVVSIQFDSLQFFELHPTGTAEKLHAAEEMLPIARRISRTRTDAGGKILVTIPRDEAQAIKQAVKTIRANSLAKRVPSARRSTPTKSGQPSTSNARRAVAKRKSAISRKPRHAANVSRGHKRST
jgi:diadenosine tetraphosphatase ApaH/serine/threonine PP2A family protein phosphatase